MQPGGKGRLTTKASNFSKELDEDFLSEVFCLRDVAGHSQTEGVNPAIMPLVKLLKGCHVALSRFLRQCVIRLLRLLGFDCGHVFVCWSKQRNGDSYRLFYHDYHESARFKEAATISLGISQWTLARSVVALNAGVMQRFERVVALPDPKDIEFPQPQQHFPSIPAQVQ
jgi:hypothetical protein